MTLEEKYNIALQALIDIDNPIGYFKRNLKEGENLNGAYIITYLNKNTFYQEKAKEVLGIINKESR